MNCLVVLTAVTSSGVAMTQPIFQPVKENVLPAELMRHGPLAHAGERRDRHVLAVEHQVLVDLVGDHEQVALDGERGDGGQLVAGEDRARGVVRAVEQDEPGAFGDGLG
jgi:hypothetical protein